MEDKLKQFEKKAIKLIRKGKTSEIEEVLDKIIGEENDN